MINVISMPVHRAANNPWVIFILLKGKINMHFTVAYLRPFKSDKTVQYRFCIPIIPDRDCQLDELAVTMETETDGWSPHVREVRCACPGNMYELVGWWRHKTHLSNNTTGLWIYEYYCDKPTCETDKSLCAKVYMDKEHEMTVGYHFQCACPRGYKCPSDIEDEDKVDYSNDSRGVYVPRYCQAVFKNART
ncbi:hypothetical protein ACJMK2_004037 [Sinanodonta woodiana]|uniref:Uncharacterized protein n=1 Tax=Sinanodonta woodiana TaxID=1069815 RepID=A0ABD3Y2P7_SINWO